MTKGDSQAKGRGDLRRACRRSTRIRTGFVALALGLLAAWGAPPAAAQQASGRIAGRVVSERTGEGLPTAQVFIPGTSIGTLTDLDGRYVLNRVPPGTYDLAVQLIGYGKKTVTGVQVTAGGTAVLDISLNPQAVELEAITVTAEAERGSTNALLSERKRAPIVVDAIGSQQIDKSPDSDAASALKRVPGISVVDGKYVHVRGLGERYGSTTLNGAPLPSPEPDKKVIPLDLIPASFLESVATAKTYTPDQPGDYAGGLVQIQTRSFPSLGLLKLKTSLGYNTRSSLRSGLGYAGGDYDFFGFDDGTRDLPSIVPADRPVQSGTTITADEAERIGEAFVGAWGPAAERHPLNQSYGLTFGREIALGERALGFFGSITHSSGYAHQEDIVERVFSQAGAAESDVDYLGLKSTHQVSLGGLLNASLRLAPTHRISLTTVYSRNVEDEARILEGFNLDSSTDQRNTRLRYLAQALLSTQLSGQHLFPWLLGSSVSWRAGYSRATRYEPNTREVLYRRSVDGRFLFDTFVQSGSIFHQDLVEDGVTGAIDWKLPFNFRSLPASFGIGAAADVRDRSAFTRRFRFIPQGTLGDSVRALPPDQLFTAANIAPDSFQIQEATFPQDNYDADQSIYAAYGMLDLEVLPRLRLVGGARVEKAEQTVVPRALFQSSSQSAQTAGLQDTDVLPGVNLTYALNGGDMNLRAGVSRTLARPQLRELAPFAYADYAGGHLVAGNPFLNRSRIENYDLRWEWFLGPGAVLSVGGFYKVFDDPIEVFVYPSTELIKSWVNADRAENYGAELELRSPLGFLAGGLENLYVNTNLTFVQSDVATGDEVTIYLPGTGATPLQIQDRNRPLQGQSPYVVNVGLTYVWPGRGTSGTVLYNRFGRRVDAVGGLSLPDVYEEARDQLDIVVEQAMPGGFDLKVTASRILGNRVTFTQGGELLRRYDTGRTISLSLNWGPGAR